MSPIKRRNMIAQVFIMIATLGIYGIYWFYQTAQELKLKAKDEEASPTLWTVLLFVPFGPLYSYFQYSELYQKVGTEKIDKWLLFILWIFFSPAIWFIVQRDLNIWSSQGSPTAVA